MPAKPAAQAASPTGTYKVAIDPKVSLQEAADSMRLRANALNLKLVDRIGYMEDALAEARQRAGTPEDSKVIVYRRTEYPDDNIYNPTTSYEGGRPAVILDTGLSRLIPALPSGFYYLWHPALD